MQINKFTTQTSEYYVIPELKLAADRGRNFIPYDTCTTVSYDGGKTQGLAIDYSDKTYIRTNTPILDVQTKDVDLQITLTTESGSKYTLSTADHIIAGTKTGAFFYQAAEMRNGQLYATLPDQRVWHTSPVKQITVQQAERNLTQKFYVEQPNLLLHFNETLNELNSCVDTLIQALDGTDFSKVQDCERAVRDAKLNAAQEYNVLIKSGHNPIELTDIIKQIVKEPQVCKDTIRAAEREASFYGQQMDAR